MTKPRFARAEPCGGEVREEARRSWARQGGLRRAEGRAAFDPAERAAMTRDDLPRLFAAFVATHLDDFRRDVRRQPQERVDFRHDGVTSWLRTADLTAGDALRGSRALAAALPLTPADAPGSARRQRPISFVTMPLDDGGADDHPEREPTGASPRPGTT